MSDVRFATESANSGLLHLGNSTPFDHLLDAREQRCRHFEGPSTAASIHRRVQPLRRRLAQLRGFAMLRAEETRCMSYVERVLQPGEQIRHISSIHWIVYWAGVGVALLAAALTGSAKRGP
jgi:hypothetical protein